MAWPGLQGYEMDYKPRELNNLLYGMEEILGLFHKQHDQLFPVGKEGRVFRLICSFALWNEQKEKEIIAVASSL